MRRLASLLERFFERYMPDPLVLAVLLSGIVLVAAVIRGLSPVEALAHWGGSDGIWRLLAFTTQMVLVLLTGHALALSPPIARTIERLASLPQNGSHAAALVALISIATSLFNWGLGLIVGALLARAVCASARTRSVAVHAPLVAAAGYSGLMCWHGGLSGTAPLMMTGAADVERFLGSDLAQQVGTLGLERTLGDAWNLATSGGLFVLLPLTAGWLGASGDASNDVPSLWVDDGPPASSETPAERIFDHPITMLIIALPVIAASVILASQKGLLRLDPNRINLFFLGLGLLLHGSLRRYASAFQKAVAGSSGILLQFPLYAGILGLMQQSHLAADLAALGARADASLSPLLTFISAGLLNLLVPSGGGQWAIQGPLAVGAAVQGGWPTEEAVMAVAYGDQWSNMLQPFWALPLLAITRIPARRIVAYTSVFFLVGGLWMAAMILLRAFVGR